jgi:dienelactone hydrolase
VRIALLLGVLLLARPAPAQELRLVPVTVDGEAVRLAMRVYQPAGDGPFPTLLFNHGSTGHGRDPARFVRPIDFPGLARFFVARGWAVVMPARRGRGGSEGLYDEGFEFNRADGYACDATRAIPGADRALRDVHAAVGAILAMPFVDRARFVIGGQSRGGILSVAYAGLHPEGPRGVINFVGGWSGAFRCNTDVNQTLFRRGGAYRGETLWLYGEADPYYSIAHSQRNFTAFQSAGGKGTFLEFFPPSGADGHQIIFHPALWQGAVDSYLARLGLPAAPGSP